MPGRRRVNQPESKSDTGENVLLGAGSLAAGDERQLGFSGRGQTDHSNTPVAKRAEV
jgi:hypothetical protein